MAIIFCCPAITPRSIICASIGAERSLVGPAHAEFPFVDLAAGQSWTLRLDDGRLPFWIFDRRRRVPGTRRLRLPGLGAAAVAAGRARLSVRSSAATERSIERLVEPLLLAALNIDPPHGSAKLAAAVIRETLAAGGRACRPLIARDGLGADADRARACAAAATRRRRAPANINFARIRFARQSDRRARFRRRDHSAGGRRCRRPRRAALCRRNAGAAASTCRPSFAPSSTRISASSRRPDMPPILGVVNGTVEWIFAFPGRVSITISAGDRLDRHPARRTGEDDLGRSGARRPACRRRCRRGRSCASAARPSPQRRHRMPNVRAPRPHGAILCSPAIGLIPACPRPSKARSARAIAPPTSIARALQDETREARISHERIRTRSASKRQRRRARFASAPTAIGCSSSKPMPPFRPNTSCCGTISRNPSMPRSKPVSPPICAVSRALMTAGRCSRTATST